MAQEMKRFYGNLKLTFADKADLENLFQKGDIFKVGRGWLWAFETTFILQK